LTVRVRTETHNKERAHGLAFLSLVVLVEIAWAGALVLLGLHFL
jgi:hypothetical protein